MRTNLPVSNMEYLLNDGASLVSKTDTKGRITYFNPTFMESSGFSRDELLGAPHNLIRHPDMPEEAFADLGGRMDVDCGQEPRELVDQPGNEEQASFPQPVRKAVKAERPDARIEKHVPARSRCRVPHFD